MKDPYDCGLIIKELREKANMTQQELGDKTNRDKDVISRYENNYQPVPLDTMRSFAAIFNVSMDYLAGMEKQRSIPTTGLTDQQVEVLRELSDILCELNSDKSKLTTDRFEIIGKIVYELFK